MLAPCTRAIRGPVGRRAPASLLGATRRIETGAGRELAIILVAGGGLVERGEARRAGPAAGERGISRVIAYEHRLTHPFTFLRRWPRAFQ